MTDEREQVSSVCAECGAFLRYRSGATHVTCPYCEASHVLGDQGLVRLACPACHGNFYYIDGAMCGKCPYCEASLLALTNERLLRWVIPPEADAPLPGAELQLVPFWRLTALLYCWDINSREAEGKRFRGIVASRLIPDATAIELGITNLRLRLSVHPMEPFAQEHESLGRVLPVSLDPGRARARLYDAVLNQDVAGDPSIGLESQRVDLLLETLSVIYYPFWILNAGPKPLAWDGVSGDEEAVFPTQIEAASGTSAMFDQLKVVELSCGECGSPLPAGTHSVVLPCASCGAFWVAGEDGLEAFTASYADPQYKGETTLWLPQWQVSVEVSFAGKSASRVAEMYDVLGVRRPPGCGQVERPDAPLCYYAPAYGSLRGPRLDVVALDMTLVQPVLNEHEGGAGERICCFNGPEDARRMAYVSWIKLLSSTKRLMSLRVQPREVRLWYLPFQAQGIDLLNLMTGAPYNRQVLRGVR
jgi:LSD1 subclass zinc finger protein